MLTEGIYTALITPFTKDNIIDYKAYTTLVEHQIQNGIMGLVPCGTTGEASTLSTVEYESIVEITCHLVKKRIPVIVGIGSNNTEYSILLTKIANTHPVDALLLVMPYYNKPSQEGIIAHVIAIAKQTDLPIILYNVPSRTGINLDITTIRELQKILSKQIIGIKEATQDIIRFSQLRMFCGDDFLIFSGDDASTYPALTVGANGAISVSSHILPKQMVELFSCWKKGDTQKAQEIHYALLEMNETLFIETNPMPVKRALYKMNYIDEIVRLPLVPLHQSQHNTIDTLLKKYSLIP
ncbi:MAG: 4-hydroxy-tetrahydrodipicolinate synthase [Desulfovibrionaceae bacterium]